MTYEDMVRQAAIEAGLTEEEAEEAAAEEVSNNPAQDDSDIILGEGDAFTD